MPLFPTNYLQQQQLQQPQQGQPMQPPGIQSPMMNGQMLPSQTNWGGAYNPFNQGSHYTQGRNPNSMQNPLFRQQQQQQQQQQQPGAIKDGVGFGMVYRPK